MSNSYDKRAPDPEVYERAMQGSGIRFVLYKAKSDGNTIHVTQVKHLKKPKNGEKVEYSNPPCGFEIVEGDEIDFAFDINRVQCVECRRALMEALADPIKREVLAAWGGKGIMTEQVGPVKIDMDEFEEILYPVKEERKFIVEPTRAFVPIDMFGFTPEPNQEKKKGKKKPQSSAKAPAASDLAATGQVETRLPVY